MILTDLPSDTILEICYYLPPLSLIRFMRTCKKLWNLRHKLVKEHNVKDYAYYVSRELWYQGVITAINHKDLEGLEFFLKKCSSTRNRFENKELYHAAKSGRRDIVDMVISYGYTIWSNGIQGAARGGHKHLVEYFIEKDPSLDKLDTWNEALFGAACEGNIDMATYCIDKGATDFNFAFKQSASCGTLDMMKFLYSQIDQTDISVTLNECLLLASLRCNKEIIEYPKRIKSGKIERSKSDIDQQSSLLHKNTTEYQFIVLDTDNMILTDFPSDTILEICCHIPPLSLIRFTCTCKKLWNLRHKLFKEHVKNYEYYGSHGLWSQGVITAINHQDLEGLEFFLKKYSSTNPFGVMELYHAGKTGRRDIVDMVISYGDTLWYNGLQGAARGGHTHLVEYFIEKDPSLDNVDTWDEALIGAACEGNIDMAKYCIDKGATEFEYAFKQCASYGTVNMMKFLYPQIVQTDTVTLNECLRSAAVKMDKEMIEYLVELGASDWNAGLVASVGEEHMKKRSELIEYFIAKGANDWNGALKAAIDSRNEELMEMFLKKGADLDKCIEAAEEEAKNLGQSELISYGFDYDELCEFKRQYDAKKRKTE